MADNGHSQRLAHVMSARTLLAVWAGLMVLTGATVLAVTVDFGAQVNLWLAMAIATVKASLVVLFFMHLLYDRRFNLFIFLGSLAFVFLFVSFVMLDSAEYQGDIRAREAVLDEQR